jgi:hypothetical protein
MNKQEQLKKLTWKYFWQQKLQEVGHFFKKLFVILGILLGSVASLIVISIFTSRIGLWLLNAFTYSNEVYYYLEVLGDYIACSFMGILLLLFLTLVIGVIYNSIRIWIKSNWKKAKRRAKRKLKIK